MGDETFWGNSREETALILTGAKKNTLPETERS
jgi:hypothetical protein